MRIVAALLAFTVCSILHAQPAPISQLRQSWVASLEARNLESALALYAPDASFINPDGTHATNPAELRQLYMFVFAAFSAADAKLVSRSTGQSGDLAFDSGSYTETVTERGAEPGKGVHHLSGDYLTLYRRSPSGWLIIQQVWTEAHHIPGT